MDKLKRFVSQIRWYIVTPPNNLLTALPSLIRYSYWVFYVKPFRKFLLGKYFSLDFVYYKRSGECGAVYAHRYVEYEMVRFITFWLKPGDTMIDVGSNIGTYSLLAAAQGATVHSIEPLREVLSIEQTNIALNGLQDRVFPHNLVLTDQRGEVSFYIKDSSLVSTTIYDAKDPGREVTVESRTLDDLVNACAIERIAMLKIDVEGAEGLVIRGGLDTIKQGKVDVIYWESNHMAPKKDRVAIKKLLSTLGYEHFGFEVHGRSVTLRPWKEGDANCVSVRRRLTKKLLKFNG